MVRSHEDWGSVKVTRRGKVRDRPLFSEGLGPPNSRGEVGGVGCVGCEGRNVTKKRGERLWAGGEKGVGDGRKMEAMG